MIRRRRPTREIPFSFDSFLDIVANVVGIIIRLILVVWVGAQSYSSVQQYLQPAPGAAPAEEQSLPADPLEREIALHRQELEEVRKRLLAQMSELEEVEQVSTQAATELTAVASQQQGLATERSAVEKTFAEHGRTTQTAALSLGELRQRSRQLANEIKALDKLPPATKTLRYRTPVSRPVQSEELLFECRNGRVTFIDIAALLAEVKQGLEDKGKLLRTQWLVSDETGPVGAFRLRYTIERERGRLDTLGGGAGLPEANGAFRYGLTSWQVEAIAFNRGETLEAALADGSEFRQVTDGIDPQHMVVTFWVYADSFPLFRRLRDYLYERDIVVAGRPLPEGFPIASSRQGSASRGQ
jgi:hypothetical protein